jgi:murein DD-endopeptidase MepM/ murein hydrolase activator NlpD
VNQTKRTRRRLQGVLTGWLALPGLLLVPPARADETSERLAETKAALEGSSAEVQAAGLALARTAQALPAAQAAVSQAQGRLTAARAVLAEAQRRVVAGEVVLRSATRRVEAAAAQLQESRDQLSRLARRTYQLGPYQQLTVITGSGPDEFLERTALLEQAFRGGDDIMNRLAIDRLALEREQATLRTAQAELDQARDRAARGESQARELAERAQQAAAKVRALVRERARALQAAKQARAQDLREYAEAQAASRELARRLREAAARNSSRVARSGQMLWPADGPLTSRYGWRTHPIYGDRRFHAGIDIGAGYGSPVWAAEGGTVVYAGAASGYGTLVLVSHGTRNGRDIATAYAHMSAVLVTQGQQLERGQQVGRVGNEGNSTGPHLHFEVRLDGDPVDPLDYVSPP